MTDKLSEALSDLAVTMSAKDRPVAIVQPLLERRGGIWPIVWMDEYILNDDFKLVVKLAYHKVDSCDKDVMAPGNALLKRSAYFVFDVKCFKLQTNECVSIVFNKLEIVWLASLLSFKGSSQFFKHSVKYHGDDLNHERTLFAERDYHTLHLMHDFDFSCCTFELPSQLVWFLAASLKQAVKIIHE